LFSGQVVDGWHGPPAYPGLQVDRTVESLLRDPSVTEVVMNGPDDARVIGKRNVCPPEYPACATFGAALP
jgi:hypothetical protein